MNKQGQSIVEYSLIAILVVLGILFMGPYVLRSIDAHFKLWEDGTQDSYEENLKQANLDVIPLMNATCQCTQSTGGSCGGPTLLCPANEHEIDWTCTPYQGCNGASGKPTCSAPDPACCGCPVTSGCGSQETSTETTPYPPIAMDCPTTASSGQPCPSNNSSIPGGVSCFCPVGSTSYNHANCQAGTPDDQKCCSTPLIPTSSPCYYGYKIYNYLCGSNTASICVKYPYPEYPQGCSLPTCTGSITYPGSTLFCATKTGTPSSVGLTQNTPDSYVCGSCTTDADCPQGVNPVSKCSGGQCTNCAPCDPNGQCQAYCVAPYIPNAWPIPDNTASQCILHFVVAANSCSASTNYTSHCSSSCTGSSPCNVCACSADNATVLGPYRPYCYSYGNHNNCHTTVNDESFTVCSSGLPIASVAVSPGFPTANNEADGLSLTGITLTDGNVCGSPEGMPGDGCNIDVSWGNNN